MSDPDGWDVIVVGGGAAGLMCGLTAAARGQRTLVVEHNTVVGEKIRISGGGRCNFTNLGAVPACFLSSNPRFCSSALARYTPKHFIALVEKHGIAYHEKKLGQLFCDDSSQQIIDLLLDELRGASGFLRTNVEAGAVYRDADALILETPEGALRTKSLVVATGGLSIPLLGATPWAYKVAEQFGLAIVPPRAALVPITWNVEDARRFEGLAGVSFDCKAHGDGPVFREQGLFTHRGLSGPAILQASSYWQQGGVIHIDLDPDNKILALLEDAKKAGRKPEIKTVLSLVLTQRLAARLCEVHGWNGPVNTTKDSVLRDIAHALRNWEVRPGGSEGHKKAEVTVGGIDTRGLDPKTMMAKAVPGLYFIGECVDVTGWLGGYNFQWAWASGHAAGEVV